MDAFERHIADLSELERGLDYGQAKSIAAALENAKHTHANLDFCIRRRDELEAVLRDAWAWIDKTEDIDMPAHWNTEAEELLIRIHTLLGEAVEHG